MKWYQIPIYHPMGVLQTKVANHRCEMCTCVRYSKPMGQSIISCCASRSSIFLYTRWSASREWPNDRVFPIVGSLCSRFFLGSSLCRWYNNNGRWKFDVHKLPWWSGQGSRRVRGLKVWESGTACYCTYFGLLVSSPSSHSEVKLLVNGFTLSQLCMRSRFAGSQESSRDIKWSKSPHEYAIFNLRTRAEWNISAILWLSP